MKINRHIALVAENTSNTQNIDMLQYIWNNRNIESLFYFQIYNVSRNDDSRTMRVWVNHKGRDIEVTDIIAKINGYKVRNGNMRVDGGGRDMTVVVLNQFYMNISSKRMEKEVILFKALKGVRLF
ncbi:MAG: hypothetical protein J6N72_07950 [Psychrobacter sp.]|nr:hypothetical protein [Psychrobacter sp.]